MGRRGRVRRVIVFLGTFAATVFVLTVATLGGDWLSVASVSASGTSTTVAPGPLSFSPSPVEFGCVTADCDQSMIVVVTASQTVTIGVASAQPAPPFSVFSDLCRGVTLNAGQACTIDIRFSTNVAGGYVGSLSVPTSGATGRVRLGAVAGATTTTPTFSTTTASHRTTTTKPPATTTRTEADSVVTTTIQVSPVTHTNTTLVPPPPATLPHRTSVPSSSTTVSVPKRRPTTRPSPPSVTAQYKSCDGSAHNARITFAPRQKMIVGETSEVSVFASLRNAGPPPINFGSTTPTTVLNQPLECKVRAELEAVANDFTYSPRDWITNSFLEGPVITWTWEVAPVKSGELHLLVHLQGLLYVPAVGDVPAGKPFDQTEFISVKATPRSLPARTIGTLDTIAKNPIVLLLEGTGLLALVGRRAVNARSPNHNAAEGPKLG